MNGAIIYIIGIITGGVAAGCVYEFYRARERRDREIRRDWQRSDLYEYGEAVANLRTAEQRRQGLEDLQRNQIELTRDSRDEMVKFGHIIAEQKRLKAMFGDAIVARTR